MAVARQRAVGGWAARRRACVGLFLLALLLPALLSCAAAVLSADGDVALDACDADDEKCDPNPSLYGQARVSAEAAAVAGPRARLEAPAVSNDAAVRASPFSVAHACACASDCVLAVRRRL